MTRARSFVIALAVMLATSLAATTEAADALPTGKGINTLTRYIERVTLLEAKLHAAVNRHDAPALNEMLSPFFEIRRPNDVTVQREAWLREGVKGDGVLHDLRVYEVGANAIASFALVAEGQPSRFIIDVWTIDKDEWSLRVRFESPSPE